MRLITLTSLDGGKRLIDADKILDIGVAYATYDFSENNIRDISTVNNDINFVFGGLVNDLTVKIGDTRRKLSNLEFCYKIGFFDQHENSEKYLDSHTAKEWEELKHKIAILEQALNTALKGIRPDEKDFSHYPELKETELQIKKWKELELEKSEFRKAETECTRINMQANDGTYQVLVKETPDEVVKLLNND